MASHYQHPHPHLCQHYQAPPPSTSDTHCCCNPSHRCCSPPHHPSPPPPPLTDQLLQAIASLLCQSDPLPTHLYTQYPQFETHKLLNRKHYHKYLPRHRLHQPEGQAHSTIASLFCRIEALESSLHHFSSSHSYHSSYSLRDTAARIIQTRFRAFLVRRSRTLRQLKELAFIKSGFNSLKSSFSDGTHIDFTALSHKTMDLLLQLDSIEGGDPMIRDGKGSLSRDLIQFLDSIEGVAAKKHSRFVKATKNTRSGQNINKSRVSNSKYGNLGNDQRKLLENLRGRVEKISRLCRLSANDEEDVESEGILHVADDDGDPSIVISRRNGIPATKNGVFVQTKNGGILHVADDDGDPSIVISRSNGIPPTKNGVFVHLQPKVKKSVSFAEGGNISKIYSNTYEPAISDGSSSSDDQGEVLENISCEVEDVMDSSRGAEDDEEAILDNGGSAQSSDGERNSRRHLKKDGRNEGKLVFSAPLPLKMETRDDLMKSKAVRIVA